MKRKIISGLIAVAVVAVIAIVVYVQKTKQPIPDTSQPVATETSNTDENTNQEEEQTSTSPNNSAANQGNANNTNTPASRILYKNEKLGYSFTLPSSWKDRYVIREESDGTDVCYKSAYPEGNKYPALIFSIINTASGKTTILNRIESIDIFEAKGQTYLAAEPRDVGYEPSMQDYKIYRSMTSEISDIFKTLVTDKTNPVPNGILYNNEKSGYSFVLPSSWKDKYRIDPTDAGIYIDFKQANPGNIVDLTIALFAIVEESSEEAKRLNPIPNCKESFVANGITYKIGVPTYVTYESSQSDYDVYETMKTQVPDIIKTLKY